MCMAFEETYPALHSLGLTSTMLLAVATDSDNDLESSTAVSAPVITKEAILELYVL